MDDILHRVRQDYIIQMTAPDGQTHAMAMCNGIDSLLQFISNGLQAGMRVDVRAAFYPPGWEGPPSPPLVNAEQGTRNLLND